MRISRKTVRSCPCVLALAAAFPAFAQHEADTAPPMQPETASDSQQLSGENDTPFRLTVTPYAWLTSFQGDLGVRGLAVELDMSFSDVLKESDTIVALMGSVELAKGRFLFQFNGAYSSAEFSDERGSAWSGPLGGGVSVDAEFDAELRTSWLEFFAGYRMVESPWGEEKKNVFALDGFLGVRRTSIGFDFGVTAEANITLPDGTELTGGVERELSRDADWFEPFIGLRASSTLAENLLALVRADVGGFGVDGSEFSWQILTGVGYQWRLDGWSLSLLAGYRALGQDYSEDEFVWDTVVHGPIFGLSAEFSF